MPDRRCAGHRAGASEHQGLSFPHWVGEVVGRSSGGGSAAGRRRRPRGAEVLRRAEAIRAGLPVCALLCPGCDERDAAGRDRRERLHPAFGPGDRSASAARGDCDAAHTRRDRGYLAADAARRQHRHIAPGHPRPDGPGRDVGSRCRPARILDEQS